MTKKLWRNQLPRHKLWQIAKQEQQRQPQKVRGPLRPKTAEINDSTSKSNQAGINWIGLSTNLHQCRSEKGVTRVKKEVRSETMDELNLGRDSPKLCALRNGNRLYWRMQTRLVLLKHTLSFQTINWTKIEEHIPALHCRYCFSASQHIQISWLFTWFSNAVCP